MKIAERLLVPSLVVALIYMAAMPAMADPLEIYFVPSDYYLGYWQSGGGPDVCAQPPGMPDTCGPVNSVQVFIETPGVSFEPGTTPQNEGGTVTPGGNGNEVDGWSQQTVNPQYLFMSGPTYDGVLDAFLFVEGSQDFTFDYYFNEPSGVVIAGSGIYGEGPSYPINGQECYSVGGPLIDPGETTQATEPVTWMLAAFGGWVLLRSRRRVALCQGREATRPSSVNCHNTDAFTFWLPVPSGGELGTGKETAR